MMMRARVPLVQSRRSDQFHKFLKPGALARMRDSRITARSHRINSLSQISLRSSSPPPSSPSSRSTDVRIRSTLPIVLLASPSGAMGLDVLRKKLVAAKYALFVSAAAAAPSNLTLNPQDLIVDSVNNDAAVVAN